jgi:eukaryotic-like serine/threonine-protein kinase
MGHELPGYVLRDRLGVGAAAEVFRAEVVGAPGRLVVVKRLRVDATPRAVDELRREAAALAALSHPSILPLLDVVPDGDRVALVLPFAAGGSLADRLARTTGGLAPAEVADLGARIGGALAAAHNAGLVHRDVKPANLLFDAEGQPLLSDFGTALLTAELAPVAGTAEYLDPAVVAGGAPDARSDVYGLGVTLYEALAGVPPYAGSAPQQTLAAADRGVHVPLGGLTDAPAALVATIERAMARDPADRFPTASALAGLLDEHRRQLEAGRDHLAVPQVPPVDGRRDPGGERPGGAGRAGVLGAIPPGHQRGAGDVPPPVPPDAPPRLPAAGGGTTAAGSTGGGSTGAGAGGPTERSGTRLFGPAPPGGRATEDPDQRGLDRRLLVAGAVLALLVPLAVAGWLWRSGDPGEVTLDLAQGPEGREDGPADLADDDRDTADGDAAEPGGPEGAVAAPPPPCPDAAEPDVPDGATLLAADVEGRGCSVPVVWDGQQLTVHLVEGEPVRYDLGATDEDVLLLGDWSCDGQASPALYRPSDGRLFVFDGFDDDITATGTDTGVADGHPEVVTDADGCDRVEVRSAP